MCYARGDILRPARRVKMKEKGERGYTVLAVIITLIVISIMVAMIIPRFNRGFLTRLNVYNTTHLLVLDLRRTRRLAITKAENYVLEFFNSYTTYKVYPEASGPGGAEEKTIPSEVTCGGTSKFTFTKIGTLNSTVNGALSLSADSYQRDITVYKTTGRVRLQ